MENQTQGKYRQVLIQVSDLIDQRSFEKMKFRCDGIIPRREKEKIKSPTELWTALEVRDHLGVNNLRFLKELLTSCMERNVGTTAVRMVEGFEGTTNGVNGLNQPNGAINTLHQGHVNYNHNMFTPSLPPMVDVQSNNAFLREFKFLSSELGKEWEFFMRELEVPNSEIEVVRLDFPYTKQRIYQCLLVWLKSHQGNATKDQLINALREVGRVDLAERI